MMVAATIIASPIATENKHAEIAIVIAKPAHLDQTENV
jgi:hypothetical protein